MSDFLMNTYARLAVAFTHGEGCWLFDEQGKRYLDAISGLGVTGLGHAQSEVAKALCEQAGLLIHTSNLARIPWQEKLAEKLAKISGMDKSFICNSGTEAIECALKIVRLAGHERGIDKPGVIVMENSFHGRTMAALSATGSRKAQAGFEPLVSGFVRVPFNDLAAVEKVAALDKNIAAILVEPIQGEAGIQVPDEGYLKGLRDICDRNGWLLVLDEIQSGVCRTGKWYAYQHENILPDILTSAKALANGVPIGACMARGKTAELLTPGRHGTTFGGNPLACRAACTVLDIMESQNLCQRAGQLGERMLDGFKKKLAGKKSVVSIRGKGLMLGIELNQNAGPIKEAALEAGIIINVTRDNIIRLLPPLITDDSQADTIVNTLSDLILAKT
ncbi:MAG: aspartate aminotransferase family protein [Xanthomonadales bacterium]|nr:aspartate aminotransferase family protein [Xanthomonadales bacterium]